MSRRIPEAARRDDQRGLNTGLTRAVVLGVAGKGVLIHDLVGLDVGSTDNAYGSIFHTLAGFAIAVAGVAVIMAISTIAYGLAGHYNARRFSPVDNVARFWTAATAVWVVSIGVLYGAPYLT